MPIFYKSPIRGKTGARLSVLVFSSIAALGLQACTVGPDFRSPQAPSVETYTQSRLPVETSPSPATGDKSQRFKTGQEIPAEWWTLFRSEPLNALIVSALEKNPSIEAARASLTRAKEDYTARSGATLLPSVDAGLSASRRKSSSAAFGLSGEGSTYSLYNASVSVSYSLDIFGGSRRELESLAAQADYRNFQFQGAYLALTANIVTTAVKEASLRSQIKTVREIASLQEKTLRLVERQFEFGGASRSDILAQQSQLARTRASIPPLEKELVLARNRLAVLSGQTPAEAALPEFNLDGFTLPEELPVSLPSTLVRQRPDILASEALLHAASAQIGVATADLYPKITLTGGAGYESAKFADLFDGSSNIWSLAAGLVQPVFRGGELSAKRRAAIAAFEEASAVYRETVLLAFQNVADVLESLELDSAALKAHGEAEEAARKSLEFTQRQFELGAVSYLALLNADRDYRQTRIDRIGAQAARYSDTAALFQALGGAWWKGNGLQ